MFDVLTETTIDDYEDIMSNIDLKKVYGSAVLFKNNSIPCSDKDVINVCNKVIHVLTDYIKQCKKKTLERKAFMQFMKNFKPI